MYSHLGKGRVSGRLETRSWGMGHGDIRGRRLRRAVAGADATPWMPVVIRSAPASRLECHAAHPNGSGNDGDPSRPMGWPVNCQPKNELLDMDNRDVGSAESSRFAAPSSAPPDPLPRSTLPRRPPGCGGGHQPGSSPGRGLVRVGTGGLRGCVRWFGCGSGWVRPESEGFSQSSRMRDGRFSGFPGTVPALQSAAGMGMGRGIATENPWIRMSLARENGEHQ